jgi:hypothetical protein
MYFIMKSILVTSVFILLGFTSCNQKYKALDDEYGFEGTKFEMPVDSFVKGKTFSVNADDLYPMESKWGGAFYHFYKGQLDVILVTTYEKTKSAELLSFLQESYGNPIDNKWEGKKVLMEYFPDSTTVGDVKVLISSKKLLKRQKEDIKRANK